MTEPLTQKEKDIILKTAESHLQDMDQEEFLQLLEKIAVERPEIIEALRAKVGESQKS